MELKIKIDSIIDTKFGIKEKAEYRYQLIKDKAINVATLSDNYGPNSDAPQWFDAIKYEKCMRLARKYISSLVFCHGIGLLLLLQIPSALKPILATGNSSTVSRLFRRYLSTFIHIKSWYESNPFDRTSRAAKSLMQVKSMHKQTALLMNGKSSEETGLDILWLNQNDFVNTQWAFIGLAILYPKQCGLHPTSDVDIEHLSYLWRVIGFCLGIDDQFNLCSGNLEEDRELCRMLFERDIRPVLENSVLTEPIGWQMCKGIALAIQSINPMQNFQAFVKYWYPTLQIQKKCELTTVFSKLSYLFLWFSFRIMMRCSIFHWIYSMIFRIMLALAVRRKHHKSLYLQKRYSDLKFEDQCPFSIEITYYDGVLNLER